MILAGIFQLLSLLAAVASRREVRDDSGADSDAARADKARAEDEDAEDEEEESVSG